MKNRISAYDRPIAELSPTEKQLAAQNIAQAGMIIQMQKKINELQRWMFGNQN